MLSTDVLSSAPIRYTNAGQQSLSLRTGRQPNARMSGLFAETAEYDEKFGLCECMRVYIHHIMFQRSISYTT